MLGEQVKVPIENHSHHWHTILTSPGAFTLYGIIVVALIAPAFMAWYKRKLRRGAKRRRQ